MNSQIMLFMLSEEKSLGRENAGKYIKFSEKYFMEQFLMRMKTDLGSTTTSNEMQRNSKNDGDNPSDRNENNLNFASKAFQSCRKFFFLVLKQTLSGFFCIPQSFYIW